MNSLVFQQVIREAYKQISQEESNSKKNMQNIFTPYHLCECIINKLKEFTNLTNKRILVLNLEFAIVLMEMGISANLIWFWTDCKDKAKVAEKIGVNVMSKNCFGNKNSKLYSGKKFDVVLMNPPYQAPKDKEHEGRGKCGTSLWEDFSEKSIEATKEDGYICAIHPSRWRKPKNKLGEKIKQKQIKYLEIQGVEDGIKTFGCQSRYDWYIMQNSEAQQNSMTKILDQEEVTIDLCIKNMPFIPNARINEIMSLVAKDNEKRVNLVHSFSVYETRSEHMSKEQTAEFKYPCVYSIDSKGNPTFWYSSLKYKEHFVPKVIFPGGAFQSVGVIVDIEGEYGLTQFAKGIIDTKENLPLIRDALLSKKFVGLYKFFSMSTTELDKDVISLFRHDFWREFI